MDTNSIAKKGYLEGFLRGFGQNRRWQRRYYVLYHSSVQCQPRLDYYPDENSFLGDKAVRKTIYIEEIKTVVRHQEAERLYCLHIMTDSQKDHVLSAGSKLEATQWLNAINDIRDRLNRVSDMMSLAADDDDDDLFDENICYDSLTKCMSFEVVVQQTEAADRCNISEKPFNLVVAQQNMALISQDDAATMYSWQYSHIRRYGRNKLTFLFEAGRKCPSGPGMFILKTKEGQKIFQEIRGLTRNMRGGAKGESKSKTGAATNSNSFEPPAYEEPELPQRGYKATNSYKQHLPPEQPKTAPPARKLNIPSALTQELQTKIGDQKKPMTPPLKNIPGPHSPDLIASLGKVRLVNDQPQDAYTSVYEPKRLDTEYSTAGHVVMRQEPPNNSEHAYALYDYTASSRYNQGGATAAPANNEYPTSSRPTASLLAALRGKPRITNEPDMEEYAHLNISATPFANQRAAPQPTSASGDNPYELAGDFEQPPPRNASNDNLYDEVGGRG